MNRLNKRKSRFSLMDTVRTSHRSSKYKQKVIAVTVTITLIAASLAALRASASTTGDTYDNCYEDNHPTLMYSSGCGHLNTITNIYGCYTNKDKTGSFHMWSFTAPCDEPLCDVGYGGACELCHDTIISPTPPPTNLFYIPFISK